MLSNISFLRNLPIAILPEERLKLEAIAFSLDSIQYSYNGMRDAAFGISNTTTLDSIFENRLALFSHAWGLVDQIHALRCLLKTMRMEPNGVLEKFVNSYENASLARNYMDHVHQNIKNLSISKKQRPPIFGSINFCLIEEKHLVYDDVDGCKKMTGCCLITVPSGRMVNNLITIGEHLGGEQIEYPVGRFMLSVKDLTIKLSKSWIDANDVANRFETHVRNSYEELIRNDAMKRMINPDEILSQTGSDIVFRCEMAFEIDKITS
jgi:hypothetical protein